MPVCAGSLNHAICAKCFCCKGNCCSICCKCVCLLCSLTIFRYVHHLKAGSSVGFRNRKCHQNRCLQLCDLLCQQSTIDRIVRISTQLICSLQSACSVLLVYVHIELIVCISLRILWLLFLLCCKNRTLNDCRLSHRSTFFCQCKYSIRIIQCQHYRLRHLLLCLNRSSYRCTGNENVTRTLKRCFFILFIQSSCLGQRVFYFRNQFCMLLLIQNFIINVLKGINCFRYVLGC